MRLCFGSYLAVLVSCKAVNVDNKQLCETLLHSVAPNFEFTFAGQENPDRVREDASSKLLRCEQNLPKDVTGPARKANPQEVVVYFRDNVLSLLDRNLSKQIILSLKDIIANDHPVKVGKKMLGIDDDTKVELVSGTSKKELASQTEFCFHSFLAGVFLYTATNTTNRSGKATIKSINREYVLSFTPRIGEIKLLEDAEVKRVALVSAVKESTKYGEEFAENVAEFVVDRINQLTPPSKQNDSLLVTLLSEANGNCLECGKKLGIPKRGKVPIGNCEIVYLKQSPNESESYENAVVLCTDGCAQLVPVMSETEIEELLENKRRCADMQAFLDRISGIRFQDEIEAVLREVHKMKNVQGLEPTDIKDLVEIERKIQEPFLLSKQAERSVSDITAKISENIEKIESLEGRREKLCKQNEEANLRALGIDPQQAERLAEIKGELGKLNRRKSRLISQLNAIRNNMPDSNGVLKKDFSALLRFFPDAKINAFIDVETFHAKINGFLREDIEEEISRLTPQIEYIDADILSYEKQITDSGIAKSLSQSILTQYARVSREIDNLVEENEALRNEMAQIEKRKEIEYLLASLRKSQEDALAGAQADVNAEMKRINDIITGGHRAAPELTLRPDKTFEFETPDDKSEGTAFKGLVVFDLSMLALTPLPALIHDSSIVKRIEDADFEQILGLYQESSKQGKQVFIAFDKADSYTPKTFRMLEEAAVLRLSVGNELFGTSWSRQTAEPELKSKEEAETKQQTDEE